MLVLNIKVNMRKLFFVLFAALGFVTTNAQKLSFDAKYIKVGVASNTGFVQNQNTRNIDLGGILDKYNNSIKKKKERVSHEINEQRLNEDKVGKLVLDKLLQRTSHSLNIDALYDEALHNTTVEEIEAAILDISADYKDVLKKEIAIQLLKNNYVVVAQEIHWNSDGIFWQVFHVDIDDEIINQVFLCWNDISRYDQINVPVKFVAEGYTKKGLLGEKDWVDVVQAKIMFEIGKKVPAFAVRGPITSKQPLTARMGRNMGVKQADRAFIYRFKENRKGEIYSKKICTARTTQTDEGTTVLYPISGRFPSYKKGDIAVLRDRKKSSISLMYQGSFGGDPRHGGRLQYERMLSFSKAGVAQYFIGAVGYNQYNKEPLGAWGPKYEGIQPQWVNYDFTVGYGIGFNFWGRVEIMPYAMLGLQIPHFKDSESAMYWDNDLDGDGFGTESGWVSKKWEGSIGFQSYWGVKVNINLFYPIQLTGGVDYNLTAYPNNEKGYYSEVKDVPIFDAHKFNRLNVYAGLRWSF